MKTILVPVNFSACAGNAAHYAADMAQALHADVHLIHVVQVPIASAEMVMTEYLYQEMVDSANIFIKELQAQLVKRTAGKIQVDVTLDTGNIGARIKMLCEKLDPYAVVLGASGPTLEKFLAGSPVSSLLSSIRYPVIVVPETAHFQRFRRVALACDLNDIGSGIPLSLPLLKDLREHFGTRFDVVTVETSKTRDMEQTVFASEGWKTQLKDLYPENNFIRSSTVEEGLLHYLGQHEADLVIVFPKKHGFFEFHVSQSKKLAKHSPIPVMSLHE